MCSNFFSFLLRFFPSCILNTFFYIGPRFFFRVWYINACTAPHLCSISFFFFLLKTCLFVSFYPMNKRFYNGQWAVAANWEMKFFKIKSRQGRLIGPLWAIASSGSNKECKIKKIRYIYAHMEDDTTAIDHFPKIEKKVRFNQHLHSKRAAFSSLTPSLYRKYNLYHLRGSAFVVNWC